jgi:murein DD-endopeptidase MepM/ murein hydrolase activator NlpD
MQRNPGEILAQKALALTRNSKLHWWVALSALPLFGVVAAFGIAPDTLIDQVPLHSIVQSLSLPVVEQSPVDQVFTREQRIQRGDTVAALLARLQVEDPAAVSFLRNAKEARSLLQLRPGKTVQAQTNDDGDLLALQYLNSAGNLVSVAKSGDEFKVSEQALEPETRLIMKSGQIQSSLFAATDAAGMPDQVAIQLADIFSSEIDFHRDLRRGDRFSVVYEVSYHNGEPVKSGRVFAAEFVNQGVAYQAVYFEATDGRGGYYSFDGSNLRKAFLRSPLEFSRITSGFSLARYHPILQAWRAHRGVDYGAPSGTRVKATSDGTVAFIGKQGGYGNLVVLQHLGKYSTYYGHLSGFAKGLRKGMHVRQGDVIAFVGMTGLATGPHLHYEFHVNGIQQNPLKVVMPEAPPITAQLRPAFEHATQPLAKRLVLLRATNIARLD